ncbi:hypothetical protein QYM36_019119 [Artemia franciscana]|uniref:Transposase n=1 Tax=Artemia franciscana TaxID=6661 RepID=A0AA88HBB1_ARTSF|nr:hypothetical protein QYM36_019119 [Artemia franciscana]
MIPPVLFNLLAFLIGDMNQSPAELEDRYAVSSDVDRKVLAQNRKNLAQDILFQIRKIETPKHAGLGIYVYHKTRSKTILKILNKLGMTVSSCTVHRILTTKALNVEKDASSSNGIYIPEGIEAGHFVHFAMDNLDFEEHTDDGGSSHVTTTIAIQPSGSARMDASTQ